MRPRGLDNRASVKIGWSKAQCGLRVVQFRLCRTRLPARCSSAGHAGRLQPRRTIVKTALSTALIRPVIFLLATLASAQRNDGIATLNGGRTTVLLKPPSQIITPAKPLSAGLV